MGEAEYACALFIYMRIIGYPAERISIITTYNGQASLIKDVVNKRCGKNLLIGMPGKVCILIQKMLFFKIMQFKKF